MGVKPANVTSATSGEVVDMMRAGQVLQYGFYREGAKTRREEEKMKRAVRVQIEEVATHVVDGSLRVHRELGAGLLESVYQACLAKELSDRGLRVECEVPVPVQYRGFVIELGFRLDMLIDELVVVENKCLQSMLPIHEAQLLTYLKLSGMRLGFLINWNVPLIKDGIKRMVLHL